MDRRWRTAVDTGPVTLTNVFEIEPDKLESFLAGRCAVFRLDPRA